MCALLRKTEIHFVYSRQLQVGKCLYPFTKQIGARFRASQIFGFEVKIETHHPPINLLTIMTSYPVVVIRFHET